jgi:hypothetical protein
MLMSFSLTSRKVYLQDSASEASHYTLTKARITNPTKAAARKTQAMKAPAAMDLSGSAHMNSG